MVVGLKTYHDHKSQLLSVFSLVASYNRTLTKYWSTSRLQGNYGDEMCPQLRECFTQALQHFEVVNSVRPHRIVVYREALNFSGFDSFATFELQQLHECLQEG